MDEAAVMIRRATPVDADDIARLWEALVDYHYQLDPSLPQAAPDGGYRYALRLIDRMEDSHTRVFVAEENGVIVGYVLAIILDLAPEMFAQEYSGFLADIYVDEQYRQQGIGRQLVEAVQQWFAQCGVAYYEWYVASKNPAGLAFWRSVGGRDVLIRMRAELNTLSSVEQDTKEDSE
jgi:ribosomal protein S18 acetylase RimI-like enzyme